MGCSTSRGSAEDRSRSTAIDRELTSANAQLKREIKLLLLGPGESGKSTIAKQMKILHMKGFSREELETFRPVVYSNLVSSMRTLCVAARDLGIELKNRALQEKICDNEQYTTYLAKELTPQMVADIKEMWADPGIQVTFARSREFQLFDSAKYLFESVDRISQPTYIPSDQDVLRARLKTTGVHEIKFEIDGTPFRMVDVGGQRSERKKWIHCFQDVTAVLFCVALSEYDLKLYEDDSTNRMMESLRLFKEIVNTPWFTRSHMILFLNKRDLFEEKIRITPLTVCFSDYKGKLGDFNTAVDFITQQFLVLNKMPNKKVFPHITCATDTEVVRKLFFDVKEILLNAQVDHPGA